jgi:hypothetical protein
MVTNCVPFLAYLFWYLYDAEFARKLLRDNSKKLAVSFNHTFRYIDDVLSVNNQNFHNYVDLITLDELEIKDLAIWQTVTILNFIRQLSFFL